MPYFFNLSVLTGVDADITRNIKIDKNRNEDDYICSGDRGTPGLNGGKCGDGILQMVKHPVHKKKGSDYDSPNAYQHKGHKGRCGGNQQQDNQIMNLAAVNLLPNGFTGQTNTGELGTVNVRDKIKYILKPGKKTGLKCFS